MNHISQIYLEKYKDETAHSIAGPVELRDNNDCPDTWDRCEKLCLEYDAIVSNAVKSNKPLSIDIILEYPAIIAVELFQANGPVDHETRR